MEEKNIKKKRKYVKRKDKIGIIKAVKQYFVMAIVISFIVAFALIVKENIDLKKNAIALNNLREEYRELINEDSSGYITDYKYWVERYEDLRSKYLEQLQYLSEEDLDYEIYTITGYSANDIEGQGTTSTTSIGFKLNAQYMDYINIVAVDPDIIPYGSYVFIKADWNRDGYICEKMFIAGDCGGDIKGQRIDVYFSSKTEAEKFGIQGCPVKVMLPEEK